MGFGFDGLGVCSAVRCVWTEVCHLAKSLEAPWHSKRVSEEFSPAYTTTPAY